MKKALIFAISLLAANSLNAQAKDIKDAQKAVISGDLIAAGAHLSQAKRIFAAANNLTRAHYYIVEAELKLAKMGNNMDVEGIESVSKSISVARNYEIDASHENRIAQINSKLMGSSGNIAYGEFKNKNYTKAADLYNIAYQSTRDTIHLLNSAKSYMLSEDYNSALNIYSKLLNMGFTNAKAQYVATNVKSKNKESFKSSSERNSAVKSGSHRDPEIIRINSKTSEILRGITTTSIALNKQEVAVAFIDQAIAKSPNDELLLNQVFHLYKKLDAKEKYGTIMNKLIGKNPNDANVYYNFAIASKQSNDFEVAEEFYQKAIKLDPNHVDALANLTSLMLEEEKDIIDQMNSLGMSDADEKKYEVLTQKRITLNKKVVPYLERIMKLDPQDMQSFKKLKSIYSLIGQDDKLAQLEAGLDD